MRKWFTQKIQPLLLALAMLVGICSGSVETAIAAEKNKLYELGETEVTAGQEISFPFTLNEKSEIDVNIFINNVSAVTVSVYDSAGKNVDWAENAFTIAADMFTSVKSGYYGYVDTLSDVPAGDYTYKIVFTESTSAMVGAYAAPVPANISQTKATVTKGYTRKLFVSQGTVSFWRSSKESVATVDENGKVTGVKSGKAKIIAAMVDGSEVSSVVRVKPNKFSDSRITTSDVKKNRCSMEAYSAVFDKEGNLTVKISFVNNTAQEITSLKNVRVKVTNEFGETVGTYKASSRKLRAVPANSVRRFSVTIKQADLKEKTADLRNSKISCEGKYVYKKD